MVSGFLQHHKGFQVIRQPGDSSSSLHVAALFNWHTDIYQPEPLRHCSSSLEACRGLLKDLQESDLDCMAFQEAAEGAPCLHHGILPLEAQGLPERRDVWAPAGALGHRSYCQRQLAGLLASHRHALMHNSPLLCCLPSSTCGRHRQPVDLECCGTVSFYLSRLQQLLEGAHTTVGQLAGWHACHLHALIR